MADPHGETAAAPAAPTEQLPAGELTGPTRPDSLAWSQEPEDFDDLQPYTEDLYGSAAATEGTDAATTRLAAGTRARRRGGLPLLAFAVAVAAALLAVGFAAVGLTSATHSGRSSTPAPQNPQVPPTAAPPAPPPTPAPSAVVAPPSASEPTAAVPNSRPQRATTQAPASVPPSSPLPPPPTSTPSAPVPTSPEAPPPPPTPTTPQSPPSTTAYLRVPFVPVPIPIQVPANPNQPPQYQQPQYPYQQGPYQQYPGY
ncbi:MAG: hypothetical protein NVSMB60_11910 [Mycobacterium sp.]